MISKRGRFIVLLWVCLLTFSACSHKAILIPQAENTGHRANNAIIDELSAGVFSVWLGDVQLTLPVSLEEMEAHGFSVSPPQKKALGQDEYTELLSLTGNGISAEAIFYNPGNEALPWTDCPLIALAGAEGFFGKSGVTVGSTEEEVSAVYGDVDEGIDTEESVWMMYGTWLYHGLGFELDPKTRRVISLFVYCAPNPLDEEAVE
ncbi:MAG: hypothetical protein PHI98_08160 [Eubacteriales bacterium]|nr:hypothetical protein [Eubacteriales bacterium]